MAVDQDTYDAVSSKVSVVYSSLEIAMEGKAHVRPGMVIHLIYFKFYLNMKITRICFGVI